MFLRVALYLFAFVYLLPFTSSKVYFALSGTSRIVAFPCNASGSGAPVLVDSPFYISASKVNFLAIAPNGKVRATYEPTLACLFFNFPRRTRLLRSTTGDRLDRETLAKIKVALVG